MLSWGAKRRLIIIAAFMGIAVLILAWYSFSIFYSPPSCTDNKQNQGELGVDCGGPCTKLCQNQARDFALVWKRAFPVSSGTYNAVAYIENPNLRSGAKDVSYIFKLYDKDNILVSERSGTASIPPQRIVPIFESGFRTVERVPARVEFVLDSMPAWTIISSVAPEFKITEQLLIGADTLPLLSARISNEDDNRTVKDLGIVAILYDESGNARAASKTVVGILAPFSSERVQFSWPAPFGFVSARIEIIPVPYPGVNY